MNDAERLFLRAWLEQLAKELETAGRQVPPDGSVGKSIGWVLCQINRAISGTGVPITKDILQPPDNR